jgi:hypothetical protein
MYTFAFVKPAHGPTPESPGPTEAVQALAAATIQDLTFSVMNFRHAI